jgi:hypothetical protein
MLPKLRKRPIGNILTPIRGETSQTQELNHPLSKACTVFRFALPDGHNPPAALAKFAPCAAVPLTVLADLSLPELDIGRGSITTSAAVSVPEATIDENNASPLGQHYVRAAR